MYVLTGHLLMVLGAFLLSRWTDWQTAFGFWCLIEGAAVFVIGTLQEREGQLAKAWHENGP